MHISAVVGNRFCVAQGACCWYPRLRRPASPCLPRLVSLPVQYAGNDGKCNATAVF